MSLGRHRFAADQIWLFGFNDWWSWDTRYFGPIPLENVCGRLEPDFHLVIGMSSNGSGHSREQGLRVHHLANLGGLIALAGLDLEPPDFLLGALLSLAHEAATLSQKQREQVAAVGRGRLGERATGKRAWKSWNRACELQAVTLSNAQLRDIIEALGGDPPENPTQLLLVLSRVLTEVSNGAA